MSKERVQKILARAGLASRRKAEEMITLGQVTINGSVAKLGEKAEFGVDAIKVNGKLIAEVETPVYLAFYKPRGVISMLADPENRPTIKDHLDKVRARVFPVGRLDFNSEGLIFLTNDGDMANRLGKLDGIPRVYHVKVKGSPDQEMMDRLTRSIFIEGKKYKLDSTKIISKLNAKTVIEAVVMDSSPIDIKAVFELKGFLVDKICRFSIGHITLNGITPGGYRILGVSQMEALFNQPELGMRMLEQSHQKVEKKLKDFAPKKRFEKLEKFGKNTGSTEKPIIRPLATPLAPGEGFQGRPKKEFSERRSPGFGRDRFARKPRRDGFEERSERGFSRGPRKAFSDRDGGFSRKPRADFSPSRGARKLRIAPGGFKVRPKSD